MAQPPPPPRGSGRYANVTVPGHVYDFIQASVSEGLSAAQTQLALRNNGLGLRYQAILEIRREITGARGKGDILQRTPLDFVPSSAAFQPTQKIFNGEKRVFARVTVVDPESEESRAFHLVTTYSGNLTRRQITDRLLKSLSSAMEKYEFDVESSDVEFTSLFSLA